MNIGVSHSRNGMDYKFFVPLSVSSEQSAPVSTADVHSQAVSGSSSDESNNGMHHRGNSDSDTSMWYDRPFGGHDLIRLDDGDGNTNRFELQKKKKKKHKNKRRKKDKSRLTDRNYAAAAFSRENRLQFPSNDYRLSIHNVPAVKSQPVSDIHLLIQSNLC